MPVSPFTPSSQNIIGEGSGTGEALAKVVIDDQGGRATKLPLLYLTGDKNRDTLPTLIRAAGLDLEPLQVYSTRGSPSFSKGVEELFRRHSPLGECDFRPCLKENEVNRGASLQILHSGGLCALLPLPQNLLCLFCENTLPFLRSMVETIKAASFVRSRSSALRR